MPDHVHLLFLSNPVLPVCDVVQQIKGNTSHWINDHDLTKAKFVWEKGFTAFSEAGEGLIALAQNLRNQEGYHASRSFLQEVDELTAAHARVRDAVWGELNAGVRRNGVAV